MVKVTPTPANQKRKPRILWANPFCLLDTSSGASMTVRQMLLQLVARGYDVQVLGATVFDNPKGMGQLKEQFPDLSTHLHQLIEAEDGPLIHQLVVSYSRNRNHLTAHEEGLWYSQYLYMLDSFKPDVVWYYGGQTLDMLIAADARDRGIPVAFYLANGNYKAPNWCRDVDVILTDSQATADMYRKSIGYTAKPVGKFIAPERFIAEHHERKRLLFVNPSWQKGASVFVQLAEKLERERPDIELEVVEARADWPAVLRETTKRMGKQRSTLSNVTVTANTSDMRGPYSRARVLVAPSLWWESSGRVLAEAMLNGIPALITNRGGMPEMIGDAGIAFDFPDTCYEEPYQHLLSEEELQPLVDAVVNFFDDEALYQEYVTRAWQVGKDKHHLDRATDRLINALTPLVGLRAGNKDFAINQKKRHRQRLASRATKPEFKVDHSFKQLMSPKTEVVQGSNAHIGHLWLTEGFSWQFKSKIIVLDNRASLIKNGLAEQMADTNAFGIVAFDPASEVKDVKRFEGSEHIQVFQHALLGDGKAATLHACVAPEMTSILAPLPAESLPKRYQLNAKPLAELPINSVALDSINGLDSLDWLILDELSDAMAILEHGKKYLTDTLLIQARVPFQLTHEKQPSLAELQHWASRNGFRFYRFHNISHHSHLPQELNERANCATEQESADVLFLPSHERMATLSDENKTKLAFILSAVFAAHDIAFDLLADTDKEKAIKFLEAQEILPKAPVDKKLSFSTVEELVKKVSIAPLYGIEASHTLPGHLVVSLTSYKDRFDNLHLTLRSLLLQEMCPDILILWIAEDERDDLPENVWALEEYGLSLRFCEDVRSYKKIIPTLREFPNSFIVTADDDLYYEPNWLKGLVDSWEGDYKAVIAHRAHKINLSKKGKPLPYQQWKWEVGPEEPGDGLIFPTTGAGVLYPPHLFHKDVTNKKKFMELCPTADDIWLYWMASLNGAKSKRSSYEFRLIEWPSQDEASLWKKNIQGGGNDRSVKKLMKNYGVCWKHRNLDIAAFSGSAHKKNTAPKICLVYRGRSGSNTAALHRFFSKSDKNLVKAEVSLVKQETLTLDDIIENDIIVTTHGPLAGKNINHILSKKITVDLWHGFAMKTVGLKMPNLTVAQRVDIKSQWSSLGYVAALGESDKKLMEDSFSISSSKVKITGYPRNDFFYQTFDNRILSSLFGSKCQGKKVVVYCPTYRESVYWPGRRDGDKKQDNVFGLEGFDSRRLDSFLAKNNIFLCVKPHPAEEAKIKEAMPRNCNNMVLVSESMLDKLKLDLYEILAVSDALITDFSSVFIDYLLLGKPILFVMPDRAAYENNRGLLPNFDSLVCGPICNAQDDLENALMNLSLVGEEYKSSREKVRDLSHKYVDGNSSKRVWDLLLHAWEKVWYKAL